MSTPEGKVKKAVRAVLDRYPDCYVFMPVQMGMGMTTVDYLICFRGLFVAIETKAPGKKPTKLQEIALREIEAAGGTTFVVAGEEGLSELVQWLEQASRYLPCSSPETTSKS